MMPLDSGFQFKDPLSFKLLIAEKEGGKKNQKQTAKTASGEKTIPFLCSSALGKLRVWGD